MGYFDTCTHKPGLVAIQTSYKKALHNDFYGKSIAVPYYQGDTKPSTQIINIQEDLQPAGVEIIKPTINVSHGLYLLRGTPLELQLIAEGRYIPGTHSSTYTKQIATIEDIFIDFKANLKDMGIHPDIEEKMFHIVTHETLY